MTVLVPPDGHDTQRPPARNARRATTTKCASTSPPSPAESALPARQQIIEPIFGHTKFNRRADRFRRRGLAACRAEWQLITATHNLLKLYRASTPTATA